MTQVWIAVKALPSWRRHGIRMQLSVWQVIVLAVNAKIRLWQRRMSPMMEVWNHLHLQVCEVWCKSYSYLVLNIFTDDVDYDYLWCQLWLFLTWTIMIFVVLYVCVLYILYLNYSSTDIPKIKPTVWSRQKLKRLKVRLSGGV